MNYFRNHCARTYDENDYYDHLSFWYSRHCCCKKKTPHDSIDRLLLHKHHDDDSGNRSSSIKGRSKSSTKRGMMGLIICVVICIFSMIRQSFNMVGVTQYVHYWEVEGSLSSSSSILISPSNFTTDDYSSSSSSLSSSSSITKARRPIGFIDSLNKSKNSKNITTAIHHPRMIVLSGPFSSSLSSSIFAAAATTTSTSTIVDNMIYLLDDNYLSSMKDSSARVHKRHSVGTRYTDPNTNAIKFNSKKTVLPGPLLDRAFTATTTGDRNRNSHGRSMVLSDDTGTNITNGEENENESLRRSWYRDFERDWFQKCIPVIKEEYDDNRGDGYNRKAKPNKTKTSDNKNLEWDTTNLIRRIRPTCNTVHEIDISTEDNDKTKLLSMEGSWRSVWKFNKYFSGMHDNRQHSITFIKNTTTTITGITSITSSTIQDETATKKKDINKNLPTVLKLLHTHLKFDSESFSIHQLDAIVMEALTASRYIVNSYGFCGQSVLTAEAMSSGRTFVKNPNHKWLDRLRIARDLARGLADLHALSPQQRYYDRSSALSSNTTKIVTSLSSSQSSLRKYSNKIQKHQQQQHDQEKQQTPLLFAHHDINFANVIAIHPGQIQWNDFNLGIIDRHITHDITTHTPTTRNMIDDMNKNNNNAYDVIKERRYHGRHLCPVPIRYASPLWRSPEEILNQTGYLSLREGNTPQAADVYSLGNVLFQVLTRHQPWTHLEINNETKIVTKGITKSEKEYSLSIVAKAKLDGKLPNLPERYVSRNEAKILWEVIKNCFQHNPKDRPLALDVAEFLGNAYDIYKRRYVKKYKNNGKRKTDY